LVVGHEKIFSAAQLFIKYGSKDFHISSSRESFHVVGPTEAGQAY
jgi:hypothetical protein